MVAYIPREKSVNAVFSTIAAKCRRAVKFGDNDYIQSVQADFADVLCREQEQDLNAELMYYK